MNPIKKILEKMKRAGKRLTRYYGFGASGTGSGFSSFGNDAYMSTIVRACIRPIADQTAKATPSCKNEKIERMLKYRPNPYMNGKDFLCKVRTWYELKNTVFIIILREAGEIVGFYPIPYMFYEALEDEDGQLYVKFTSEDGKAGPFIFLWDDVIVLRKDYNRSNIVGDDNAPLLNTLDLLNTANQSIAFAVKNAANLRGILKLTKSMVKPEDLEKTKNKFLEDYMSLANNGGIAVIDNTMDYQPLNMSSEMAGWTTMREFRENVYRYFGVSDDLIMSKATPDQMQAFYELKIEPFLLALSIEMTGKVFSERELAFGNRIIFTSNTIQLLSMSDKLNLREYVDRGAMTPNEWRDAIGLPPIPGGDEPIRRLDTAPVDQVAQSITEVQSSEENEQ